MVLTTFPPITLGSDTEKVTSRTTMFHSFHDSLHMLQRLTTDCILYLAYGIAILCSFKIILHMINGVTSNAHMGARVMDDITFYRGASGSVSR